MASPLESAITLEDVFAMVNGKRVPLAPELAGYLCLEIAEKAEAARASGDVDPRSVYIADEGTVALVLPRGETAGDAESSIRGVLGHLLDASGSSTAALSNVARRGGGGGLRPLMEDLEAALIPVNRAAGRRALARLAREVKRVTHGVGRNALSERSASGERVARGSRPDDNPARPPARSGPRFASSPGPASPGPIRAAPVVPEAPSPVSRPLPIPTPPPLPPPTALFDNPSDVDSLLEQFSQSTSQSEQAVSRDLKGLVDIGDTAAPPVVQRSSKPPSRPPSAPPPSGSPPSAPPAAPDVDELLALTDVPDTRSLRPEPPQAAAKAKTPEPPRAAPNPRELPTHQSIPVPTWAKPKKKRTDYWIVIAVLAVLAAASAAVWLFKPGFLSGRTAEKVAEEKAANEALRQKMQASHDALLCHASIDVTDAPASAEVLLRVGQAPVDVPHLPVGARLEFVATAEGFAPKRAVVPANAPWDNGPDGKPRFELAVELSPSTAKGKAGDVWPPVEPGSEVGGKGPPGTVHVVSTPRGAEIWMLAGVGPEALVEQLPCDQAMDVLVAGPTTYRKRLKAAATDFVPKPGDTTTRVAKLSAK